MAVVVGAVLAAPLARLPPQDGRADELHGGEDDEADAGREEREEPEEPGGRFNGNQDSTNCFVCGNIPIGKAGVNDFSLYD